MSAVASDLPDARVLDLFAGSGALGLEALSRGASHVTFVESAASALKVLQANLALLNADAEVAVVRSDALRFLRGLEPLAFDMAFADPPYGKGIAAAVAEIWAARPFAGLLCIEHRRDDPIPTSAPLRQKSYGDTVLTFLRAPS